MNQRLVLAICVCLVMLFTLALTARGQGTAKLPDFPSLLK